MRPPDNDDGGLPAQGDRRDITINPPPSESFGTLPSADDAAAKPQVKGAMGRGTLCMVPDPGFGHDHDTPDLRLYKPVCTQNQVLPAGGGNDGR